MIEVVQQVEAFAIENDAPKIDTLVLQIGELSSVVPEYLKKIYPMAIEHTLLEATKLEIEIIPGNGKCKVCKQVFNLLKTNGICPQCAGTDIELLSGKEFFIKEIICFDADDKDT